MSADAGETATVAVDQRAGNVTLDTVEFVSNESATAAVNVTSSEDPLPSSPDFDISPETEGIGYFSIEHSGGNEALSNVTLTVRVQRSTVAEADASPDEIALYRYDGGRWVAQPTRFVREDGDAYVYQVLASGFSEWVAGTNRPEIRVSEAGVTVEASATDGGDRARIDARITNNGDADGVYVTRLLLEGEAVDERRVTVPDGGTVQVTFDRAFEDTGTYAVTVNNVTAGTVEVSASGNLTVRESGPVDVTPVRTTSGDGPLFPGARYGALLALLLALGARCRSRLH